MNETTKAGDIQILFCFFEQEKIVIWITDGKWGMEVSSVEAEWIDVPKA